MNKILLSLVFIAFCRLGSAQSSIYSIMDYGAVNDGKTITTKAIQKAIDDCAFKGGGTIIFPAGKYLSGTLYLKSFITLFLGPGAVLEGSKNLSDYPVTLSKIRSYTDNYTSRSLIYGEDLEHIAITGQGIIDGNGASFQDSDEQAKTALFDSYKVRPYMIRIINCKNVVVRDISIINSPMWVQHYMACVNVSIDGISVHSRVNHNNDGIDIDACDNVRISNCDIVSGDDAIVIKSTLDRPCKNITITNSVLSSDCNAFKLGTESNGGFQNISMDNCIIYNTRLAGIALEMVDGGSLDNVSVSDINMDNVNCAIFIRLGNRARPFKENMSKPGIGRLFNVILSNIQATSIGKTGCSITGLPSYPARNITLNNIRLTFKGGGTNDLAIRKIEEFPEKYPEFGMFGLLPSYGFFCRHIVGLTMENIDLSYELPDYRPALYLNDVEDSRISDLKAFCEEGTESLMVIDSSKNIIVRDCNTFRKPGALANIKNGSSDISFINNNIFGTNVIYKADDSIDKSSIKVR